MKGRAKRKSRRSLDSVGNLSKDVFERRKSTGSGLFRFLSSGFAQIFSRSVKKLSNTNFIASRHIKREKFSLPVDVRLSKTPFTL